MCNESNVFILFHFLWGCYGGALVFLGGAGAPASPCCMRLTLCAHILYFDAAKFSIKLFSLIFFSVSVVRQRDEYK